MIGDQVSAEQHRRPDLRERLIKGSGGPKAVAPAVIRDLGIYGGAQGIWVDKGATVRCSRDGNGIAVAVLRTGRSYADDAFNDGIIYHYPKTNRPGIRDESETSALRNA